MSGKMTKWPRFMSNYHHHTILLCWSNESLGSLFEIIALLPVLPNSICLIVSVYLIYEVYVFDKMSHRTIVFVDSLYWTIAFLFSNFAASFYFIWRVQWLTTIRYIVTRFWTQVIYESVQVWNTLIFLISRHVWFQFSKNKQIFW